MAEQQNNVRIDGKEETQTAEESVAAAAKAKQEDTEEDATGESSETGSGDDAEQGDDDKGDKGNEDEDDTINPDTKKPYTAEEWRDKFRASSKGANDLLETRKKLEADIASVRADSDKTLKEKDAEIARLRAIAEEKNPDGLKLQDLAKENKEVKDRLVLIEEDKQLDGFLSGTKIAGAKTFKEALRALARANPAASLADLWGANLKAGAEAAAAAKGKRDTTRKEGASDSGRGSSSREQSKDTVANTGLSKEEFDALPVAKRKQLLMKAGM